MECNVLVCVYTQDIMKSNKLQMFGHRYHMPDNRLIKTVSYGTAEGNGERGSK